MTKNLICSALWSLSDGKEIFKKFDKRQQEKMSTNDLGPAFRAMSLTVKPDQLKEWADLVDEDGKFYFRFAAVLLRQMPALHAL